MRVVMLGHSGAGKTTYASLMYAAMLEGVEGFQVRADDEAEGKQLLEDAEDVLQGRYPDPTHQRAAYDLTLCYAGEEVLPFTWQDYRGGALSDRSGSADVDRLHADLTEADGIVLFVDSRALLDDPASTRRVRRLVSLVTRALDGREEVLTPLVIALTKTDLVDVESRLAELVAPFQTLIDAVSESSSVQGTIVDLVCGPSPVNVVAPVLWCLRFGIEGLGNRLLDEIETANANHQRVVRGRSAWTRFWDGVFNDDSSVYSMEADRLVRLLEPLVEPAEGLEVFLEDLPHF